MDLDERIERQPGSHLVRVPRKQIKALKEALKRAIAERDSYWLKVQAFDRLMRQQAKRRQVDKLARAIAANPKGRL